MADSRLKASPLKASPLKASPLNLPNAVSALRLVLAPVLLILAHERAATAFLVVLCVSLVSDIVDGKLARRMNLQSELGAKLDSWGDFATYMLVPVCAWWLRPEFVRDEAIFFVAVVASYTVPVTIGFARYRRLTSYHTLAAKLAAYAVGAATVVIFAGGSPWPFRLATALLVYAELEEILITFTLADWHANVATLAHARRIRAAGTDATR